MFINVTTVITKILLSANVYFLFNSIVCLSPCKDCTGINGKLCLSCISPDEVVYDYSCIANCPTHYFEQSKTCYSIYYNNFIVCNELCENCTNHSKAACTSCWEDKILWNSQCVSDCPPGFYLSDDKCESCPPLCATCISSEICITCLPSFYISGTKCVEGNECSLGTYPNSDTMTCDLCSKACLSCFGPTNINCIECNEDKGFVRSNYSSTTCLLLQCTDGTYLELETYQCLPCHESCQTCDSDYNCIKCATGYMKLKETEDSLCITCPEGYETLPSGKCQGMLLVYDCRNMRRWTELRNG